MPTPKSKPFRGIVHEIGDIEFTGAKNDYPRQRILLFCPAKKDQHTGKLIGRNEFFMLDVHGNKVEELHIHEGYQDKVVEVEVSFSGNCYQKKDKTGRGYSVNSNLLSIKIITEATTECTQAAVDLAMGY